MKNAGASIRDPQACVLCWHRQLVKFLVKSEQGPRLPVKWQGRKRNHAENAITTFRSRPPFAPAAVPRARPRRSGMGGDSNTSPWHCRIRPCPDGDCLVFPSIPAQKFISQKAA